MRVDEEKFLEIWRKYDRVYGILTGLFLVSVTASGLIANRVFWQAKFISDILTSPALIGFNLAGLYWILTGIKPNYKIDGVLSRNTWLSRNQIQSIGMLAGITLFWGFMISLTQDIIFIIIIMIVTSPAIFFGYYGLFPNKMNPLDRKLKKIQDKENSEHKTN